MPEPVVPAMTVVRAPLIERLATALPDAVTAGVFAYIWIAPLALGEGAVRNAMLLMLVEFVLVHASGFLGGVVLAEEASRRSRIGWVCHRA